MVLLFHVPCFEVTSFKMLTSLCFLLFCPMLAKHARRPYRADREVLRSVNFKTPFLQANFTGEGLVPLETVMSRLTRNFDVANLVYNKSWQTVTEEIPAKENVSTESSLIYIFRRCSLVSSSCNLLVKNRYRVNWRILCASDAVIVLFWFTASV